MPELAPTCENGKLLDQMLAPRILKSRSSVWDVCTVSPPRRKRRSPLIRGTQPIAKKQKCHARVPELAPTCENGELLDQMFAPSNSKSRGSARDVCTVFFPGEKRRNLLTRGTQPIAKKQKCQARVPGLAPTCQNGELLDQIFAPRTTKSRGSARDACTAFTPGRKKGEIS